MNGAASRSASDWATASGDAWAARWTETDRALEGLSPALLSALTAAAPDRPLRAFEVGCGAGSTVLALADARRDASICACDLSPALVQVARERTSHIPAIEILLGNAEMLAGAKGPFDLIYSRHGVMFFDDPVRAFRRLREAAAEGGSLVFSCFRAWAANPWASELACAAAGKALPPPGREPSGFAFADPDYVLEILRTSGWSRAERRAVDFDYVAGGVDEALSFLSEIGPASSIMRSLPEDEREGALGRMRGVVESYLRGAQVVFPAAAWIWSAGAA